MPTLHASNVYLSSGCYETQSLDARTDQQAWEFKTDCFGGGPNGNAFFDGRIFVRSDGFDATFALNGDDGSKSGEFPAAFFAPAFDDGIGFFAGAGTLVASDLQSGASLWTYAASYFAAPPLVVSGFVYILDDAGTLVALDVKTGNSPWKDKLAEPDPTWSAGAPGPMPGLGAGEGLLVVPLRNRLYAYQVDGR